MSGRAPIIGVTMGRLGRKVALNETYLLAVQRAGGLALPLPPSFPVPEAVELLDGLLLSGGGDLDPFHYGEEPSPGLGAVSPERDASELALAGIFLATGRPVLGLCRGHQVLAVAAGGRLHQDLPSGSLQHQQRAPRSHPSHGITLASDSILASLCGADLVRVNSFHHQLVSVVPPGFRAVAWAADGGIEAIEGGDGRFLGVQWHPEELPSTDGCARALFRHLVSLAGGEGRGRR